MAARSNDRENDTFARFCALMLLPPNKRLKLAARVN